VFYGWWDWRFLGLIIASSAVDYWCGIRMSTVDRRRSTADSSLRETKERSNLSDGNRLLQVEKGSNNLIAEDNLRNDGSNWQSWFSGRKLYLTLSLIFNLGMLGFFKYFNFFIDSAADLISTIGFQPHISTLNLILPVGISFYTFQTLSYSIDVYRGNLKSTKDPIAFFTFVAFFPQLVAGPIERASNLLPQFFKKREFEYQQGSDGMKLILW
jgi:alginate O-acetyltransferase complex protein AlgI